MSKDTSEKTHELAQHPMPQWCRTGVCFPYGFRSRSSALLSSGVFLLLWEIASGRWIEPFLISSPSRILSSLVTGFTSGDLIQHTWVTFKKSPLDFLSARFQGLLGYGFGRSRLLAEFLSRSSSR